VEWLFQQGASMHRKAPKTAFARVVGDRKRSPTIVGPYGHLATGIAMQADVAGPGFHLVLVNGTRALMALGPYPECDVVAEWRSLGARTGLSLMVRMANGSTLTLVAKLGDVIVGPTQPDYRKGVLGSRRPRFLARRRTGRLQERDVAEAECPRFDRTAEGYPE